MDSQLTAAKIILFPQGLHLDQPREMFNKMVSTGMLEESKSQPLPIPNDSPRDIPRFILQLRSINCSVQFSYEAITFQIGAGVDLATFVQQVFAFMEAVTPFFDPILKFKRVGFATFFNVSIPSNTLAQSHLLQGSILGNLSGFNLNLTYNEPEDFFEGEKTNYAITFATPINTQTLQPLDFTLCSIDFNTDQTLQLGWSTVQAKNFFSQSTAKVDFFALEEKLFPTDDNPPPTNPES